MDYPYDPETDGSYTAVLAVIARHNDQQLRPDREKVQAATPHYDETAIEDAIDHLLRRGEIYAVSGNLAVTSRPE